MICFCDDMNICLYHYGIFAKNKKMRKKFVAYGRKLIKGKSNDN